MQNSICKIIRIKGIFSVIFLFWSAFWAMGWARKLFFTLWKRENNRAELSSDAARPHPLG